MCIFASLEISSDIEHHLLECWTSFFLLFKMPPLWERGLPLRPWQFISECASSGEGSGAFKRINETISCFLFDVPLIKLLMHAVDNYLMARISVTSMSLVA